MSMSHTLNAPLCLELTMTKKTNEDKEFEKDRKKDREHIIKFCKLILSKSHKYSEHFTAEDLIDIVNAFVFMYFLSSEEIEDICRIEHKKYFDLSDVLK